MREANDAPARHEVEDFFSLYLQYAKGSEVPTIFHRWTAIGVLATWIGRREYFVYGASRIYPNMYIMLCGEPGTRKSTAVKLGKRVLQAAGYKKFSAEKSSKEKFLDDLAQGGIGASGDAADILDQNLFGFESDDAEVLICADEFSDFFMNNLLDFVACLGVLWDYEGTYETRMKGGPNLSIVNPTINLISGNTPATFNRMCPPEVIGQGFFSRLLMIHSDPTNKKIAFPPPENLEAKERLINYLNKIRNCLDGEIRTAPAARELMVHIYQTYQGVGDVRFASYNQRRFTHLIKLCMLTALARCSTEISKEDVTYANTILSYAEHFMPQALGEFGAAKNSALRHKIIQYLSTNPVPHSYSQILESVANETSGAEELADTIRYLTIAGKLTTLPTGEILIKRHMLVDSQDDRVNYSLYLTQAELERE